MIQFIYTHTHFYYSYISYILIYYIKDQKNDLPKHIFWESEKKHFSAHPNSSRLPFTATGWDTESETSRVQRHEWRASCAHPLLGRVWSSLVKLASWNHGSVEEYFFCWVTTLSNNHRRNEWWRERFVFLDVLRRKGFSHWKWTHEHVWKEILLNRTPLLSAIPSCHCATMSLICWKGDADWRCY